MWNEVAPHATCYLIPTQSTDLPLLLRAVKGDKVERPPVWMMRQAGRYMKVGDGRDVLSHPIYSIGSEYTIPTNNSQVYQELCKKHTTFRERSENVDVAVEVSLQPWRAFKPDGVILFSDILTPLPGLNIPFDITAGQGPIIADPIRSMEVRGGGGVGGCG